MDTAEKNSLFINEFSKHAVAIQRDGELKEAIVCYQHLLSLAPRSPHIHNNLGIALKSLGRLDDAIKHYKEALHLDTAYAEAYNNLGNALNQSGDRDGAVFNYEKSIALKPGYADPYFNLGDLLYSEGDIATALTYFEKAIERKPDYTEAYYKSGNAHFGLKDLDSAIICYDKAIAINPQYAMAYNGIGVIQHAMGDKNSAISNYEKALSLQPKLAAVYHHIASLDPARLDPDVLVKLLEDPDCSEQDAVHLHFALGKFFDANREYDRAFNHYKSGNKLKHRNQGFQPDAHSRYIDRLINAYSKELLHKFGRFGNQSQQPIFIVGMPRSGTTLVEQILSSHPDIHGAGELSYLLDLIDKGLSTRLDSNNSYPECVKELNEETITSLSRIYLEDLNARAPGSRHVIDKMPHNFLRLGMIKILFPDARIFHCQRDPLDTCLSIYLQLFSGKHRYAYDLVNIGSYYMDYKRLMQYWEDLFPENILTINYEQLIAEPEKRVKHMLDFMGLDWDDNCLKFYQSSRPVVTASSEQVRRPIYSDSVDRWKKYEANLSPLIDILAGTE